MKLCKKKDCWWRPMCKATKKACKRAQEIDMRWKASPNNLLPKR